MERSFYDLLREKGGELEHLLNSRIHSEINQKEVVEFAGILLNLGIGKIKLAKETLNVTDAAKLIEQMEEKIAHLSACVKEMKKNPGVLAEKAEDMMEQLEDKVTCLCKTVKDLKKIHPFSCAAKKLEAHLNCLKKSVCELKHKESHEKKRKHSSNCKSKETPSECLIISSKKENKKTKKGRILCDD